MPVIDPIHSLFNELSAGLSGIPAEQRKGMEDTLHNLLRTVDNLVEANTRSERRLRELVQYAPTAMYEVDFRTGKFTSVNDWMVELSGYSRDELLQMAAFDLLDDEGKLLFRQRAQRWLAGEPPEENVEYRIKGKDGHTIYCILDVSFTRDADGRPLGASVIGHDITQRKRMERSLADSERKFRELVEHAASAIYEVDFRTQKFTMVNEAMIEKTGYSHEELMQMSPFDLLDEEGKKLLRERTRQWMSVEKPDENVEFRVRKKDGSFLDAILHTTFSWDENGSPTKVSIIAHDITERKAMEKALRAGEAHLRESQEQLRKTQEQLQLALDATQLGMYDYDILTGTHTWDIKARSLWGVGPDEVITSEKFLAAIHPEDLSTTLEAIQRAQDPNGDGRYYAEYRVVHPIDHTERWIAATGQVYFDGSRPVRLIGTVQDITDRRLTEAMRQASEARARARAGELQALMDAVPAMIWLTRDPQCREMIGNRYGFEFLRLPVPTSLVNAITDEALKLRPYQMLRDGRPIDRKDLPMHYAAATGQPVEGQTLDFVFEDGSTCQMLANVNPLLDADGQPAGAVGVMMDITNLRRLEAERQEAVTNMEVQRRLMDQREQDRNAIARDLHDGPIQTLSSTLFHLQMVKEVFPDPALTGELKHVGDEIKRTVQELRDLLNELRPPALIQFGFTRVVRMFLEDFRERYPQITVELKITADDAPLSNLAHLTLYRIFQAGINNIIRHANAGQIWVSFSTGPGCYLLEIRDDGRGFEAPNDFSELTRHSHFGLVGMKERAEAIGGAFEVSSAYGKGTRIGIKVPCNEKNMR
jgi:PAS domain S-box-containing protein